MSVQSSLPDLEALKTQAKRLRHSLEAEGNFISHSEALELIARQYGYRDWNTIHSAAENRPSEPFRVGTSVSGHYLGQAFIGEILAVRKLASGARYQLTLDLAQPVDVVSFESFSAFRKRVTGTVNADGVSDARTSNGRPHLELSA